MNWFSSLCNLLLTHWLCLAHTQIKYKNLQSINKLSIKYPSIETGCSKYRGWEWSPCNISDWPANVKGQYWIDHVKVPQFDGPISASTQKHCAVEWIELYSVDCRIMALFFTSNWQVYLVSEHWLGNKVLWALYYTTILCADNKQISQCPVEVKGASTDKVYALFIWFIRYNEFLVCEWINMTILRRAAHSSTASIALLYRQRIHWRNSIDRQDCLSASKRSTLLRYAVRSSCLI